MNNEQKIKNFNVCGKTFCMNLDSNSCYKLNNGECSLNQYTLNEILNFSSTSLPKENDQLYCVGLAKKLLDGQMSMTTSVYENSCGHYQFSDGQHRTCITSCLLNKGAAISLTMEVTKQECDCYVCGMIELKEKEYMAQSFFTKPRFKKELTTMKNSRSAGNYKLWDL